ncbi:MAG: hypothetical protein JSV50_13720, partial [Desulfobacteraceae bacterium]
MGIKSKFVLDLGSDLQCYYDFEGRLWGEQCILQGEKPYFPVTDLLRKPLKNKLFIQSGTDTINNDKNETIENVTCSQYVMILDKEL